MKKDYITLIDCGDPAAEVTALEVFFLKAPNKYRVVDDAGCDVDSGKYVAGPRPSPSDAPSDVNENPTTEDASSLQWHELSSETLNMWSNKHGVDYWRSSTNDGQSDTGHKGHKGHKGETGYEEKNIYKLILGSLDKAFPDAKDSFREVVADGIAKRITEHMTGE
jgi:hypothetical protein